MTPCLPACRCIFCWAAAHPRETDAVIRRVAEAIIANGRVKP